MEQEWTEDEDSGDQSVDPENLSGDDDRESPEANSSGNIVNDSTLDQEPGSDEEEERTKKPRRSTRKARKVVLASPQNDDLSLEIELDDHEDSVDRGDDQTEWKPLDKKGSKKVVIEKRRRKRKAPITVDRKKRERDRERRKRIKELESENVSAEVVKKPIRARGRPRKKVPFEGEFDVFDEDKTPPKPSTPVNFPIEHQDIEEPLPKEVFEVIEELHNEKLDESGETEATFDDEDFKTESPHSVSNHSRSVAMFGLEDEEEEGDSEEGDAVYDDDDDRTLSPPLAEYEENMDAENFDYDELAHSDHDYNFDDAGSEVAYNYEYHYSANGDDEDTQYSVEAELARYAREDAEMELRAQQAMLEHDFEYEEDPEIEQELEQINNGTEEEEAGVEYYMVENDEGQEVYYAVVNNDDAEDEDEIERPIPPTEFDSEYAEFNGDEDVEHVDVEDEEYYEEHPQEEDYYNENGYVYDEQEPFQEEELMDGVDYFDGNQNFEANGQEEEEEQIFENGYFGENENGDYAEQVDDDYEEQDSGYAADMEVTSPVGTEASTIELTMGQLSIGGEVIEIPDIVLENEGIFRNILSEKTFYSLTEDQQHYLKRFLPRGLDEAETSECVSTALVHNPRNYFGSPLSTAFNRIRAGYYNVDRPTDLHQLQDHRRVWYDHFIRRHYMKLLRQVVLTRQAILEQAASLPDDVPIKIDTVKFLNARKLAAKETIRERSKIRAKMLIELAAEKDQNDTDSSDDSEPDLQVEPVQRVNEAESSVFTPEFANHDLDMYQPARVRSVKDMLRAHKLLKKRNADCPSLEYSHVNLEDVFERAGLSFQTERNFLQMFYSSDTVKKRSRKRKRVEHSADMAEELSNFDDNNDVNFCS